MTRRGFTLIELVVVLMLLALSLAVVAPSLRLPAVAEPSPERAMIGAARRAAIGRAQPSLLEVASDGSWRVTADAGDDTTTFASGSVSGWTRGAIRLHVTVGGACLPDDDAPRGDAWDPIGCGGAGP